VAEWFRGRFAEAERAFVSGIAGGRFSGQLTDAGWACYSLSQVQRGQGRLDAVVRTCQQAQEITAVPGRPLRSAAGPAYACLGEVAYQRDELDTALRHLTEGIALCRQFVYAPPLAAGLTMLAWIRQATGDPAGPWTRSARPCRRHPARLGCSTPSPRSGPRLLIAQGDLDGAAAGRRNRPRRGRRAGLRPRAGTSGAGAGAARPGPARRALALLDRLHAAVAAQDRAGSVIELQALRALALAASGEQPAAVAALAGALTLACPQGYVRVFADEGPPMAALLSQLVAAQRSGQAAAGVPLGCLARLLQAFDGPHAGPRSRPGAPAAAVPSLVEQLTSRELEVLRMLAAGRSNQAIAAELVVALDTVNKHVSHLLDKLGATNRTEAVARA